MSADITRPGESLVAVTKSDTADVTRLGSEYPRALWVGGVGDVDIVTPDGRNAVLSAVPAGTLLPIRFKRVNSTLTTATLMVAIY
jgi:hypothetical protein